MGYDRLLEIERSRYRLEEIVLEVLHDADDFATIE